ncbi:hypothetical protein DM826_02785 [Halonotius aquaticus]|uniref:UPF0179 protein DM826_02785 n=1 Tax=Halonotius aquaticus TaxID=2216978 RepID=A0A3A6QCK8_9EURY|nr:UPF0179 family protein [Halonotius aquaticus]RJX44554.1 hypothetical protein DM826_02785 [Halonotius aquaticus]
MTTVTLIGDRLAEEGQEFVYGGEAGGCEGCPYRSQCLNLTEGRRYRVTTIRDNAQLLDCAMHDSGVRAVEVEPAPVRANVASRGAYAGSKAELEGPCPYTECPSHEFCVPDGADFETEYRIAEVVGEPPHDYCELDRDLTLVELETED